jgi:hypothetical protein
MDPKPRRAVPSCPYHPLKAIPIFSFLQRRIFDGPNVIWRNKIRLLSEQKGQGNQTGYLVLGGSGCGLSMTLDALIEVFAFALGGRGCGFSITLEPGDPADPDLEFLPETMMIDLSLPD